VSPHSFPSTFIFPFQFRRQGVSPPTPNWNFDDTAFFFSLISCVAFPRLHAQCKSFPSENPNEKTSLYLFSHPFVFSRLEFSLLGLSASRPVTQAFFPRKLLCTWVKTPRKASVEMRIFPFFYWFPPFPHCHVHHGFGQGLRLRRLASPRHSSKESPYPRDRERSEHLERSFPFFPSQML